MKRGDKKAALRRAVTNVFTAQPRLAMNYKQVAHLLGINDKEERRQLQQVLTELLGVGAIIEVSTGKYRLDTRTSSLTGRIDKKTVAKKCYLIPDDGGEKILIAERSLNTAMHGDTVKVHLYARRKGAETEGEVIEVIKRAQDTFVGTIDIHSNFAFVNVDRKIMPYDIFIPLDALHGAKNGQKVLAKITTWSSKEKNPIGKIIDILGNAGENNTEMHAILAEFGLPYRYPKEVEDAAEKISDDISQEIKNRKDLRSITTFTIDPRDAKDFDDAVSYRELDNGDIEVGVHIADVTYYVKPGDIINKEAEKRATSVYLVDRTIPMLPEKLCNNLCSLRPDEDKLCFSVLFRMNTKAEVLNYEIVRTVIHSNRRFTYEEAQQRIETGEGDYADEINKLWQLAKILRDNRFKHGAIDFGSVEVRFEIDEKGKPIDVYFKESKEANKLIEEFMLLANRTVATHIGHPHKKNETPKTFVYRVHDVPNPDKLIGLSEFIKKFGYKMKPTGKNNEIANSINTLLNNIKGKKEQNVIEQLTVRSMAKASYSTDNIGHYGLAFDYYTHFTSPIRRYPDMMVHRLLAAYLNGAKSADKNKYEELCQHSSEMEQLAANAERASIKYKQVEFMEDKVGQIFDGVISGVTEWGIYVELNANKCEGMIALRDLEDDYYTFDEKNYCIIGKHSHRKFQLGDPVTVRIAKANLDKKQLDLVFVD